MMTLEEMKLAVCGKLPEYIDIHRIAKEERGDPKQGDLYLYYWNNEPNKQLINWPTEGLQVCHEAEKKLTAIEYLKWWAALCRVVWGSPITMESSTRLVHEATYSQRLEALCRVWWPERFTV